jgi:starch synthase
MELISLIMRNVSELCKLDKPDILHTHDWQTALSPAFLKTQPYLYPELKNAGTVLTIHNLGYQGVFWQHDWHLLNMDWRYFNLDYMEFYGNINFLKAGIVFTDKVTTVSPTYADEIQTQEFGFGLDGVLRTRSKALTGLLNGIDYQKWNPEIDKNIAHTYSINDPTGKIFCKAELQRIFHLPINPDIPVIAWSSRLVSQKGCDLLQQVLPEMMADNIQFVLLGDGDPNYSEFFKKLPANYPGKVGVHIGYHDGLMRSIVAGADFLLLPSRYEPCGLTQLYGLRYGTPSIVRSTGGLKDTIQEFNPKSAKGNGFLFCKYEADEFLAAIRHALTCYENKSDRLSIIKNAMKSDFSWAKSAQSYKVMYLTMLGHLQKKG